MQDREQGQTRGISLKAERRRGRRDLAVPILALACLAAPGCAFRTWDEYTSREFHLKNMFDKPAPPLAVLRDSKDGDQRARALRKLEEPLEHGGTDAEQKLFVEVLSRASWSEQQPLCRLAAIQTLRTYKVKDPRIVEGLKEAYYRASSFNAETAAIVRCTALEALGQNGQPGAVELLVKVLREPPVEGPEIDRQLKFDERIAAARALGGFEHIQAATALLEVLQSEKEVALRNRAHESLQQCTGKDFPADPKVWSAYLKDPAGTEKSLAGSRTWKDEMLGILPARWRN